MHLGSLNLIWDRRIIMKSLDLNTVKSKQSLYTLTKKKYTQRKDYLLNLWWKH